MRKFEPLFLNFATFTAAQAAAAQAAAQADQPAARSAPASEAPRTLRKAGKDAIAPDTLLAAG